MIEHGNLSIRSIIPFYPSFTSCSEKPDISFKDYEKLVNLNDIRVWDAF